MRGTCIQEDEAQSYNEFMKKVKRLTAKGSYKDFFQMLIQAEKEQGIKVSLITQKESTISSNVTEAEAAKVRKKTILMLSCDYYSSWKLKWRKKR
jgi:hypothetical protein